MQVKLPRVLQEFVFEPVGGTNTAQVETRVLLATREDLSQAVAEAGRSTAPPWRGGASETRSILRARVIWPYNARLTQLSD